MAGYYHCQVKIIGRSAGHSAIASAAYRSGSKLFDEKHDKEQDFSKKDDVVFSQIFAPSHAPDWVHDRGRLWNETEKKEDKSTRPESAQLARELELGLPRQLSQEQRESLITRFVTEKFVSRGMIADANIHNKIDEYGNEYPHAHIMLSMRDITPDGFGGKNREWNTAVFTKDDYIKDKTKLTTLRADWAEYANNALTDSGSDVRCSHLSNKEQGLEPPKEIYLPRDEYQLKKDGGYSHTTFYQIQRQATPEKNQLISALKTPKTQKNLVYHHSLPLEDWEYMRARKAVEVDTEIYIEPSNNIGHVENYMNSQNNDIGLSP